MKRESEMTVDELLAYHATGHCTRCGVAVDRATAYSQMERDGAYQVRAYYCAGCSNVLQAVGAGERSAMTERRGMRI